MIKHYYQLIQQRLQNIATLKQVEWYTGQFDQDGQQTLAATPAAFIEFEGITMQQKGKQTQVGVINFSVYTVDAVLSTGGLRITDATINHLSNVEEVYKQLTHYAAPLSDLPAFGALKGTQSDITIVNSLTRTNIQFIQQLSNLLVTVQTFQGSFVDVSATKEYQKVQATLQIQVKNV